MATSIGGDSASCDFTVTVVAAQPQPMVVYNTGVDANYAPLNGGDADPHYLLGVNPDGPTGFVVVDPNAYVMQAWLPDSAASQWIGPQPDGTGVVGTYVYQVTFEVCRNYKYAVINGQWAVDNSGGIKLNGIPISDAGGTIAGNSTDNFATWHPFTITSGFVSGLNTLDFYVTNSGGYTGLRVELSGTACCCTNKTVSGVKFNDVNHDGIWQAEEQVLRNWTINAYDEYTNLVASTVTDANGEYHFTLPCGTYKIKEARQPGWVQTAPASGYYLVTEEAGQYTDLNFGNYAQPIPIIIGWSAASNVALEWQTSSIPWSLLATTNLVHGPWSTSTNWELNICNAWNQVVIPIVHTQNMFFRLGTTNLGVFHTNGP